MDRDEPRDFLIALALLPFLTPNRTRLLLKHFNPLSAVCNASSISIERILSVTPEQAAMVRNPLTKIGRPTLAALRRSTVTLGDEAYPALLREIPDPPLALHYRGDLALLARPAIAVVGSRRASPYGINVAERLARELAMTGLVLVSGMARGIDSAAHAATLEASGATIAVLGTGIDVVYPRSAARLSSRIVERGLVLSEFPPGTPPRPEHFPIRNRLISGLSLGVIVVEATARSGSLITARMAAEQGREVFAVPGSIFSAGSEGAHRLIQYGAKLVHDVGDVLDELPRELQLVQSAQTSETPQPENALRQVLAVLSREEGIHIDSVVARLGRSPAAVAQSLLELELGGWVRALPGARYVRVR